MKLYYVKDRSMYRIGRSDWPSDAFNVVDYATFLKVQEVCKLMSIVFEDATDDED